MYKKVKKRVILSTREALRKIKRIFRGFTVIELIVVISIIGTLASIILVSVTSQTGKARDSRVKTEASEIAKEAVMYYSNSATYGGYMPNSSFTAVCSGSSYEFSTNGENAFVVYAKLCASDNYWCIDSTGVKTQLENPPDSGVYTCSSGSGVGEPESTCQQICTTCSTPDDYEVCEIIIQILAQAQTDHQTYGNYDYAWYDDPVIDGLQQQLPVYQINAVDAYPDSTEICYSALISSNKYFCKDSQGSITESVLGCGMSDISRCDPND